MTQKSPEAAQNVSQYLIKRLKQANVNTKRKTLQVIAYVAENGAYAFVAETIKHESQLREMSDFRGQKDPLHGDTLNQQIRTAAQKAIQALYSSAETRQSTMRQHEALEKEAFDVTKQQGYFSRWTSGGATDNTPQNVTQSSMFHGVGGGEYSSNVESSSMGSQQHTGSFQNTNLSSGPSNNPRFQGFGNPDFNANMGNMGGESPMGGDSSDTWKDWGLKKLSAWKKTSNKPYAVNPEDYPNFLNQETKAYVPPEAPNGGYGLDSNNGSGGSRGSFVPPVKKLSSGSTEWGLGDSNNGGNNAEDKNNDSEVDEGYEAKVVEELCSSNGVRVQPTRQELRLFSQKCANLNGARLAAQLDERLTGKQKWQTRLKSLCAIETLLQANNQEVEQYFERNYENIGRQTEAIQSSVSKKANSILGLLSPSEDPEDNSHPSAGLFGANGVTTKKSGSLLDFEDESSEHDSSIAGNGNSKLPSNQHSNKDVSSLFSNLNLKASSPQQPPSNKPSTSSSSLIADDIFADTEMIPEDQEREQATRDRSNSKRSILDTLEHFMSPSTPSVSSTTSSPSSTHSGPGFAPRTTMASTPHTVPVHSPQQHPTFVSHAPFANTNYHSTGVNMHTAPPSQYVQNRAMKHGMPQQRVQKSPQSNKDNEAFGFLNKKNTEVTDKHFGFVNDLLRKGDTAQKKDSSDSKAVSSFSFIK
uniref:ENTH domain-containing protein n=1 Tax=Percolomonas cosmopolitus TaxID=63605 RepID=A0A7S1KUD6_9EUKA